MADKEIGKVRGDRGVLYVEQPDGSFAKRVEILSAPFTPVGGHNEIPGEGEGLDLAVATVLTPPEGTNKILVQALNGNIRYTLDGTTPEPAVGFQIKDGDPPFIIPIAVSTILTVVEEMATEAGTELQFQWGV